MYNLKLQDLYTLPMDDPDVWEMICKGYTKGIFQLDSYSGHNWSKKIKPRSIRELSDLIALVRPGCVDVIVDGKSMTQHYADRKHGLEPVVCQFPVLEDILKDTYYVLTYQEQTIRIAQKVAGFNLVQADRLRKAIGTKDAEIMMSLEKEFVDGCKNTGLVNEEEAKTLFGWIRESQRYSFNLSHSLSYSITSYWSAYLKNKNPHKFFLHYLRHAKDSIKPKREIKELVTEAKKFNIVVKLPTLEDFFRTTKFDFYLENDIIYFGLNKVKGVGEAGINNIIQKLSIIEPTWIKILFESNINKTHMINLTSVGFFGNERRKKLYEYNLVSRLTDREKGLTKGDTIEARIKSIYDQVNKNRKLIFDDILKLLEKPTQDLHDNITWIYETECELLGCGVSCNKTDTVASDTDTKCIDIVNGKNQKCSIMLEVSDPKEYTVKKGKNAGQPMGAFGGSDETGSINCLIFGDSYTNAKNKLYNEALIIATGRKSKDAFIVDNVEIA